MPREKDLRFKGFKLTISTIEDVSDYTVTKIGKYCENKCDMWWVVCERGEKGTRHLHALMCCKEESSKYNLQDYIWKHYVKQHNEGANIQRIAVRVDILYEDSWSSWYLSKEHDHELITKLYDVNQESSYYATEEQQALLVAKRDLNANCNAFYVKHEQEFREWNRRDTNGPGVRVDGYNSYPITPHRCFEYFRFMMRTDKMRECPDERRVQWYAKVLYRRLTCDDMPDFENRKWFASREGPVFDFSA